MRVILGPLRLNLTEWVRDIQPTRLIAWGSDFGSRSLLTALKRQHIKEIDDGSCMYYTTDIMSGWAGANSRIVICQGHTVRIREHWLSTEEAVGNHSC